MSQPAFLIDDVHAALERALVDMRVAVVGDGVRIEQGQGLLRRSVTVAYGEIVAAYTAAANTAAANTAAANTAAANTAAANTAAASTGTANTVDPRAWLAAWARGVLAVLNEPANSKGHTLTFVDCTATLMPALEGPGFVAGVAAVRGDEPFSTRQPGGLLAVYFVELDQGRRLLSRAQVEGWGVHPERLEKAALSVLFHRTRHTSPVDDEADGVTWQRLAVGDGSDSARALLMDVLEWSRTMSGLWVGVPSPGVVMYRDVADDAALAAFQEQVRRAWLTSADPLSPDVLRWRSGTLEPAPCSTPAADAEWTLTEG